MRLLWPKRLPNQCLPTNTVYYTVIQTSSAPYARVLQPHAPSLWVSYVSAVDFFIAYALFSGHVQTHVDCPREVRNLRKVLTMGFFCWSMSRPALLPPSAAEAAGEA